MNVTIAFTSLDEQLDGVIIPHRPTKIVPKSKDDWLVQLDGFSFSRPFNRVPTKAVYFSTVNNAYNPSSKRSQCEFYVNQTGWYIADYDGKRKEKAKAAFSSLKVPNFTFETQSGSLKALVWLGFANLTAEQAQVKLQELTGLTVDKAGTHHSFITPNNLEDLINFVQANTTKPKYAVNLINNETTITPYNVSPNADLTAYENIKSFLLDYIPAHFNNASVSRPRLALSFKLNIKTVNKVMERLIAEGVIEVVDATWKPGKLSKVYRLPGVVSLAKKSNEHLNLPKTSVAGDNHTWIRNKMITAVKTGMSVDGYLEELERVQGLVVDSDQVRGMWEVTERKFADGRLK